MGQDPEQLRAEIAQTRGELDQDLNTLAEKVSPGKVVERRVDAVKGAIMGVAGSAQDSGAGAGAAAKDTVAGAPGAVKDKAKGNPFAAGLVAFGAGWLLSSLIPASRSEAQAAGQLKDKVAEPLKQQLTTAANEVKDEVLPAAQEAADSLKASATDAVGTVKDQATDAADTVKEQAADSAGTVKDQAQDAKDSVQSTGSTTSVDSAPTSVYDEAVAARANDPLR